ncbi:uncharacterized protein LOC119090394 [Pollicipes pollicipes]|uniref:uncharacterized protein LOC119090381 n=1 Tax=Pollicipes pollicipes TaxID=41117 RepID=UPI0018852580|nr:uncharacterized protein LOC119090381 [Pollicipes pollicipes]XP_037069085.1 uncharacterized protein LOC119090394 [Pollicipes pollicipes]
MVLFHFRKRGFFSSVIDCIFAILFPRDACPLTDDSLKSIYKTRFTPPPVRYLKSADIFRTRFTAPDPKSEATPASGLFETSFIPTSCVSDTFSTGFYPNGLGMPYRRLAQDCRKKEYAQGYTPFFNAVSPSDGAFCSPGIVQTFKNWYGSGAAPPAPIVEEPDDIDCSCSTGSLLAKATALQRKLMCSPIARALLALAALRGVLYMLGIKVCFVKIV